MGKTTEVAADRAYDQTKTVLPAEVARGVYMENAPSLRALKLMHLMIATAGGRMAEDTTHQMRLSDVKSIEGMQNHSRQTIVPLFAELRAATIIHDDTEKMRVTIGGLLDETTVDYRDEVSGDILISWGFGRTFRRMAAESNHWAILDRQAVFHLGSKYSVLLFQHIGSLQHLKHTTSKTFTVAELRAVLGVPKGKLERFSNLKQIALVPAIDEINSDLTRLHLTATYRKIGRTVDSVTIAWEVKADLTKVKAELDRPKVGRKARRDGSAEILAAAFPAVGGISYSPHWQQIKRDAGCNKDDQLIASDFRRFCKEKGIQLDAQNIEKTFAGFCAKVGRI